jgi:hypothetical protein
VNQLAGIDWRALFAQIPAGATARAISLAWAPIIGSAPEVIDQGDHFQIIFSPEQEERAAAWIITQLNREPGPVRMETGGIAARVIGRQYWPYIAGVAAAGALLGYYFGGRR